MPLQHSFVSFVVMAPFYSRICLLSEGRVAYLGSSKGCLALFEQVGYPCPANFNPADHFIHSLAVAPGNTRECYKRIKVGRVNCMHMLLDDMTCFFYRKSQPPTNDPTKLQQFASEFKIKSTQKIQRHGTSKNFVQKLQAITLPGGANSAY